MKNALLLLMMLPFALLFGQQDDSWKLYDDSHLSRIDIAVDTTMLRWIYAHPESDSEHCAVFRFRNNWLDETVDSIGFRLRGNTSRQSAKKSFKVSFNTFVRGREFHGVEKLNLNGEHNDPSIIRSKLCFDLFKDIGIAASQANHVLVYINGSYYGLYISVEHVDDEFVKKHFSDDSGNLWKCLYPADLLYKGEDPKTYKNLSSSGRPVYELTTNEKQNDFRPLARFIRVLNRTPSVSLLDSLEALLDVPGVLKYFAMNVLLGSWDDYRALMNNYYLYHDPSQDKLAIIPYDYDNTFGIDWFGIDWSRANPYDFPKVQPGSRPLAERLLANDSYRDLYTHFLLFYRDNVLRLSQWESRIDRLRDMIASAALADSFRTLDWAFTANDFSDSYSPNGYQNQHIKLGLKQFINLRNASIVNQVIFNHAAPIAYQINVEPVQPSAQDSIVVTASCFGSNGLKEVAVQFAPKGSWFPQMLPMKYQPILESKKVEEADRWRCVIPPLGAGQSASIRIVVKDSLNQVQSFPRKGSMEIRTPTDLTSELVINEFMADNDSVFADPAGEFDDWIELHNNGSSSVLLTGMYLTDKADNLKKWRFEQPNLLLNPGGYLIVWCDEQQLQEGMHTNFKLSAGGEYIALVDTNGVTVIDSLSFGPQTLNVSYGRYPNGDGAWQGMSPTPGAANVSTASVGNESVRTPISFSVFPNPFNPKTTIRFQIAEQSHVRLQVFNSLGQEVASLVDERLGPGAYQRAFDAGRLASGVYFCRFHFGESFVMKKLLFMGGKPGKY